MLQDRDAEFGEFLDSRAAVMRRTAYLLCCGDEDLRGLATHSPRRVSEEGVVVAQATWKSLAGERRNMALVVLPDGTRVTAMTSNFSKRFADAGKVPSGGEPVLGMGKLTFVMVKSGFSVF